MMHQVYTTKGFVFKKEDRLEADRIFSVFTEHLGRTEIFAKSIRRITSKLKSGIETFSISELSFVQGRNRKTLIDAVLVKRFENIIQSPEKLEITSAVSDLLDKVIKEQQLDERIWNLITDYFEKLNACELTVANPGLIYHYFFWNFISVLGYAPELSICGLCGGVLNPDTLYFSCKEGGIICAICRLQTKDGLKVTSSLVKILRVMQKRDWEVLLKLKIEANSQKELQRISEYYYAYLL